MFANIRSKLQNMNTIKYLCERAEVHALQDQQQEPGAEHFLLAALDLPDYTARLAFEKAGAESGELKPAIARQYGEALKAIGFDKQATANPDESALQTKAGPYRAAPSGQEVMQRLSESRSDHRPLLGAHVVAVVAGMSHGVAARALRAMGVESSSLRTAADEIASDVQARN